MPGLNQIKLIYHFEIKKKVTETYVFFSGKLPDRNNSIDICDACNVAHIECYA